MNECDAVVHMSLVAWSSSSNTPWTPFGRTSAVPDGHPRPLSDTAASLCWRVHRSEKSAFPLRENSDGVLGTSRNPWLGVEQRGRRGRGARARVLHRTRPRHDGRAAARYRRQPPEPRQQRHGGPPAPAMHSPENLSLCTATVDRHGASVTSPMSSPASFGFSNILRPRARSSTSGVGKRPMLDRAYGIIEITQTKLGPSSSCLTNSAQERLFEGVPRRVPDIPKVQALPGWRARTQFRRHRDGDLAEAVAEGVGVSLSLA